MSLIKKVLEESLSIFSDPKSITFIETPKDTDDNANKWANAIDSYASSVIPPSTTSIVAKSAFVAIMKGLSDPVIEDSNFKPFTLYYISPETRMYKFNTYLKEKAGYKSNPTLDKTAVFSILNKIREEYNKLFPLYKLTNDDILYNQNRFNQIYAREIAEGKIIPLKGDGVTTNTTDLRYKFIPVDRKGKIVKLQNDGIIGDDTIRYLPILSFSIYGQTGNQKWNLKYSTIKFITQPSSSGEVLLSIPIKRSDGNYTTQKRTSSLAFKREIIDNGLAKDYTTIPIDKTQSQIDGGLSPGTTVDQFKSEFEANHSSCDPIWINNNIHTVEELATFQELKFKTYKNLPSTQKDGLGILEDAIKAYATQLATGMSPTFTGSPSPAPIGLKSVAALGLSGAPCSECISFIANLIDVFFKSGTATNNSSGATTTWQ